MSPVGRPTRLQTDDQLIRSIRRGDERAFEALHDRHRGTLLKLARRVVEPAGGDAEAVVQEAFARAHRHLRRTDAHIEAKPWLRRVVRNACIDELRRAAARPQQAGGTAIEAQAGPSGGDAYAILTRRDELRRVVENLADLPEAQRSALLMRELDGLSYEAISDHLDVSTSAVKSLIHRARTNLVASSDAQTRACASIRPKLDDAHDARRRPSEQVMRHVRACANCGAYRAALKANRTSLSLLAPTLGLGPFAAVLTSVAGGGTAASTGGATLAAKAAAGLAAAALIGGAALEATGAVHVLSGGPGVRAPSIQPGGRASIGRPIRRGTPLPSKITIVTISVALGPTAGSPSVRGVHLRCPVSMRAAGLTEATEQGRSSHGVLGMYQYARADLRRVLANGTAKGETTMLYRAQPNLPERHVLRIGTLCERH